MKIAQMLSPLHSLGPGNRVGLWTQGCSRSCYGCISPEFQPDTGGDTPESLLADLLIQAADNGSCSGLTISGGDPFEQPEALLRLLRLVRHRFDDILIYTGYTREQICAGCCGEAGIECLNWADVIIDGPYIDQLNTPQCVLRGSENQIIHYLTPDIQDRYRDYLAQGRALECFCHNGEIIVTGIQNRRDTF